MPPILNVLPQPQPSTTVRPVLNTLGQPSSNPIANPTPQPSGLPSLVTNTFQQPPRNPGLVLNPLPNPLPQQPGGLTGNILNGLSQPSGLDPNLDPGSTPDELNGVDDLLTQLPSELQDLMSELPPDMQAMLDFQE